MITESEARRIASEWHNGQTSAMYAFSSSGFLCWQLVSEINADIEETSGSVELKQLLEYVQPIVNKIPDTKITRAANGHMMVYEVRGQKGNGDLDLIQSTAWHYDKCHCNNEEPLPGY